MPENVYVILQARMSSSRLPGKVLMPINGSPMIYWQIQRILQSQEVGQLIVATSEHASDDVLVNYLRSLDIKVVRGSLHNVYNRYEKILSTSTEIQTVVRITGDCPLVMPSLVDLAIQKFLGLDVDYLSNTINPTYPDGLDVEVFSASAFLKLKELNLTDDEKEHVTLAFRRNSYEERISSFSHHQDLSHLRWTVDFQTDFDFVVEIYRAFRGRELIFDLDDVIQLLASNPGLDEKLRGILRNRSFDIGKE